MSGDTEEKVLPPSEHKLRKAREKGEVANSEGFIGAITTVAGVAYIIFSWDKLFSIFSQTFDTSVAAYGLPGSHTILNASISMYLELGNYFMGFAAVLVITAVAANILQKKGIPFSLHPIKPDFNKINPQQGLKKLFSRRNATEFGVSFVKIVLWFLVTALFLWLSLQTIITSMHCSIGCVLESSSLLGLLIFTSAALMLIFSGLMDLPLQTSLFMHEQKMGHKEFKREQKDIYGSPEFKNHRKSEHQRMNETPDYVNSANELLENVKNQYNTAMSNLESQTKDQLTLIVRGANGAVGLYYHPEHADVPVVKVRYRGAQMNKQVKVAEGKGIPVITNIHVAADILQNVDEGGIILERHFEKVALMLVDIGAI